MVQLDSRVPASKEEKLVGDSMTVSRYELVEAVLHAVAVTVQAAFNCSMHTASLQCSGIVSKAGCSFLTLGLKTVQVK